MEWGALTTWSMTGTWDTLEIRLEKRLLAPRNTVVGLNSDALASRLVLERSVWFGSSSSSWEAEKGISWSSSSSTEVEEDLDGVDTLSLLLRFEALLLSNLWSELESLNLWCPWFVEDTSSSSESDDSWSFCSWISFEIGRFGLARTIVDRLVWVLTIILSSFVSVSGIAVVADNAAKRALTPDPNLERALEIEAPLRMLCFSVVICGLMVEDSVVEIILVGVEGVELSGKNLFLCFTLSLVLLSAVVTGTFVVVVDCSKGVLVGVVGVAVVVVVEVDVVVVVVLLKYASISASARCLSVS